MSVRNSWLEVRTFFAALLLVMCARTTLAQTSATQHLLYAVDKDGPSILYVYDLDNAFALLKQVNIPTAYTGADVRGLVVNASNGMMYISHGCYYQYGSSNCKTSGYLAKYNIVTSQLIWDLSYPFSIDSHSITPDGKTIYMPTGENSGSSLWELIDANTGSVVGTLDSGQIGAHNTIVSNDGAHVYLGSVHGGYLVEVSTANQAILQNTGPTVNTSVRPFTVNSTQTLSFTTSTGLLGFQVGDITSGAILYTVQVGGSFAAACAANSGQPCSHGITLSPDDKQIYVTDIYNNYIHVYDVSGLPATAPLPVADIPLAHPFATTGWPTHTRDGRYVIVGGSGDVIDTSSRQIVGYIPALSQTEKFAEVDFQNGVPIFSPLSRSGVGYVGAGQASGVSLSTTSLTFTSQTVGTSSSPQTVTLTNNGSTALSITSVAIAGANSGDFSQTNTCGSSVATGGNCAISVTFMPTATGTRTASVTITDTDASSPQTVGLTGTGATATASVSPTSLTFASQTVGTTSSAQTVTLTNNGSAALSISSVAVTGANSGDFGQTNTCGSSVASGGNCTISVTFSPTAAGTRTGTLSISDNAAGSPQLVSLTGTGSPASPGDFSLSSSLSTVAMTAGQTTSLTVTVTPSGGFNQAVSLACQGAPQAASCSVTPGTVPLNGTASATAQVTVTTTAHSLMVPMRGPRWIILSLEAELLRLAAVLMLLFLADLMAKNRRVRVGMGMAALAGALLAYGCAAPGSSTGSVGTSGTPAGSYTLTLTGTSGSGANMITHSTTVALTVQ